MKRSCVPSKRPLSIPSVTSGLWRVPLPPSPSLPLIGTWISALLLCRWAPSGGGRAALWTSAPPTQEIDTVGLSVVCRVHINRCHTSCHPVTLIQDFHTSVLQQLCSSPSVSTIMALVGSNDLKLQLSERLKVGCTSLIDRGSTHK